MSVAGHQRGHRHVRRRVRQRRRGHILHRVALGHPNSLGFEVFGTKAAASFDLSANAEFCYIDDAPDAVTNGWRRVIVGPGHPYIAAAQSMPFRHRPRRTRVLYVPGSCVPGRDCRTGPTASPGDIRRRAAKHAG